jgi:hypothetical protein
VFCFAYSEEILGLLLLPILFVMLFVAGAKIKHLSYIANPVIC